MSDISRRSLLLVALMSPLLALGTCRLRVENPLEKQYSYKGSFRIAHAQGPVDTYLFATKDGGFTWSKGVKWPLGEMK